MAVTPEMNTLSLILNGKAANDDALQDAVSQLRDEGFRIDVSVSTKTNGVDDALDKISSNMDDQSNLTLVAGGGDGTVNAVIGGAYTRGLHERCSFGILPMGTANDLARAIGVPQNDPLAALRMVIDSDALPMDIGLVENQPFINMVTGGFGAQVTVETDPELKRYLGGFAYALSGLSRLGELESSEGRIVGDDFEWEGRFLALAVGNGRQAGGGLPLCSDALIDDGKLDLMIVTDFQDGIQFPTLEELLTPDPEEKQGGFLVRAKSTSFSLECTTAIQLNLDGEPMTHRKVKFENRKHALRMHMQPNPLLDA